MALILNTGIKRFNDNKINLHVKDSSTSNDYRIINDSIGFSKTIPYDFLLSKKLPWRSSVYCKITSDNVTLLEFNLKLRGGVSTVSEVKSNNDYEVTVGLADGEPWKTAINIAAIPAPPAPKANVTPSKTELTL